ncbi:MAG: serine protease, partial [Synechococcales cyanobacterium RM1_1_8]|nr:serine protease [Synechococcales cyanobacterium RM1_1_8]
SNAQAWAEQLATKNQFQHSPAGSPYRSKSHGENITYGRGRASSLKAMVDRWGAERQFFRNGTMPNLSTTGNWADVGHYSQIVWRKTSQLGCGFAKGGQGAEYLVCQYNPAGNVLGQKPF